MKNNEQHMSWYDMIADYSLTYNDWWKVKSTTILENGPFQFTLKPHVTLPIVRLSIPASTKCSVPTCKNCLESPNVPFYWLDKNILSECFEDAKYISGCDRFLIDFNLGEAFMNPNIWDILDANQERSIFLICSKFPTQLDLLTIENKLKQYSNVTLAFSMHGLTDEERQEQLGDSLIPLSQVIHFLRKVKSQGRITIKCFSVLLKNREKQVYEFTKQLKPYDKFAFQAGPLLDFKNDTFHHVELEYKSKVEWVNPTIEKVKQGMWTRAVRC